MTMQQALTKPIIGKCWFYLTKRRTLCFFKKTCCTRNHNISKVKIVMLFWSNYYFIFKLSSKITWQQFSRKGLVLFEAGHINSKQPQPSLKFRRYIWRFCGKMIPHIVRKNQLTAHSGIRVGGARSTSTTCRKQKE